VRPFPLVLIRQMCQPRSTPYQRSMIEMCKEKTEETNVIYVKPRPLRIASPTKSIRGINGNCVLCSSTRTC
jgi:hypothetical protein